MGSALGTSCRWIAGVEPERGGVFRGKKGGVGVCWGQTQGGSPGWGPWAEVALCGRRWGRGADFCPREEPLTVR